MFNFLEYSRVVVALMRPQGLVRDIAFSTYQPDAVIGHIRGHIAQQATGEERRTPAADGG